MAVMWLPCLFVASAVAQATDVFVTDAVKVQGKGGGLRDAPWSMWNPSIVVTNDNTVILVSQANMAPPGRRTPGDYLSVTSSRDNGKTWSNLTLLGPPGAPQALYSPTSNTVFLFGKSANMLDNGTRPEIADSLWMSKSTNSGVSWSEAVPMNVKGAIAPHYGGGGRAHGIELARGPHKGRLVLPRLGDPHAIAKKGSGEIHSFALYSDDQGETWTAGAQLPDQWDECALTELRNGSVLMSARIDDPYNRDYHHPDTNVTRMRTVRGFARSDDGGATWAQIWTLFERQPEIPGEPCSDAIVYSARTGAMYFGYPTNKGGGRANYVILRSMDEGASWSFLEVVYPPTAGYSDMTLLPSSDSGDVLGVAFQRCLDEPGLEGGGYNMGWATVRVPIEPATLIV